MYPKNNQERERGEKKKKQQPELQAAWAAPPLAVGGRGGRLPSPAAAFCRGHCRVVEFQVEKFPETWTAPHPAPERLFPAEWARAPRAGPGPAPLRCPPNRPPCPAFPRSSGAAPPKRRPMPRGGRLRAGAPSPSAASRGQPGNRGPSPAERLTQGRPTGAPSRGPTPARSGPKRAGVAEPGGRASRGPGAGGLGQGRASRDPRGSAGGARLWGPRGGRSPRDRERALTPACAPALTKLCTRVCLPSVPACRARRSQREPAAGAGSPGGGAEPASAQTAGEPAGSRAGATHTFPTFSTGECAYAALVKLKMNVKNTVGEYKNAYKQRKRERRRAGWRARGEEGAAACRARRRGARTWGSRSGDTQPRGPPFPIPRPRSEEDGGSAGAEPG